MLNIGNSVQNFSKNIVSSPSGENSQNTSTSFINTSKSQLKNLETEKVEDDVACQILREVWVPTNFFNSGRFLIQALKNDDSDYIRINDYVERGQEIGYIINVISILGIIPRINFHKNQKAVPNFSKDPNVAGQLRMMLWHGTDKANVSSILENGLTLPTNLGQWFGAGIYFSDRIFNSCHYCDRASSTTTEPAAGNSGNTTTRIGYLFLCDVLLGNKMHTSRKALYENCLLEGKEGSSKCAIYESIKGCGRRIPDPHWNKKIDGCLWPLGPTVRDKENEKEPFDLQFNEYIVYDEKRVQLKYLVKVETNATLVYNNKHH